MFGNASSCTRLGGQVVQIAIRDRDDRLGDNVGRTEQAELQRLDALRDLVNDLLFRGEVVGGGVHGDGSDIIAGEVLSRIVEAHGDVSMSRMNSRSRHV
jgi:hypothetical protein